MNIEEYKFNDDTIKAMASSKKDILFFIEDTTFVLTKPDVIALAKHFQLTADDIKE